MAKHVIKGIRDFDIATDGKKIVVHFEDAEGHPIALEFESLEVEKTFFEMGLAATKARELGGFSTSGVVPFFRPSQARSDLSMPGKTVVTALRAANGLEFHFGLEPNFADALADQMKDAARRGRLAKPETQN